MPGSFASQTCLCQLYQDTISVFCYSGSDRKEYGADYAASSTAFHLRTRMTQATHSKRHELLRSASAKVGR